METSYPVALTIAGSDSGGGAGIQADLRTFAFHKVHGTCALTCVTAQNTMGVDRVDALPPEAVAAQINAIVTDIGVHATKTGMLLNEAIIATVIDQIRQRPLTPLVVDPVMVSRTGAQLIDDRAISLLKAELLPLALIATPNRYEAEILCGFSITTLAEMKRAALAIRDLGCKAVIVKGGAMTGDLKAVDVWCDQTQTLVLTTDLVLTQHTHGTGCTLSAAIVANLALGHSPLEAARLAKSYVTEALHYALPLGQGQGPVGHFFPLLK